MNNASHIRLMNTADIDKVMRIWLDTNIAAHDFIAADYWRRQFDNVEEAIAMAEVYVYELSGEVIGFIGLYDNYIAGLFVAGERQSQGVGRQLLDYAKSLKPELRLSVYRKNVRAMAFYTREGFAIESDGTDENTGERECEMIFRSSGAQGGDARDK